MNHNWKNILVAPSATIQQVLKIIDQGALQLALVVDENDHLLGTVTDGDIRRALIGNISLQHPISEVMFKTPTVLPHDSHKSEILGVMDSKELSAVPLVYEGKVVGIETLHNLIQKNKYNNPVFLMAGGFGSRLQPLTNDCPKPMLPIGDRPILEILLLRFIEAGFHRFYFSTHYLSNKITEYFGDGSDWGVSITYIHEEQPLGTGGALGLLPEDIGDLPIVLMNGDVLTTIKMSRVLDFHNRKKANATICVREFEYQVPFGVVETSEDRLIQIVEKPTYRYRVNAGIYVLEPSFLARIEKNKYIDMPTLLSNNLKDNIYTYPFHDYWLDIGRMSEYERAQRDIKNLDI